MENLGETMNFKKTFRILGIMTSLSFGLLFSDAYAYIDPGSGSMIIQMIIGALVGVGITIKIYWYRLKEKFISKKSKAK